MQYILKLSIALGVVYLFYWLLLRRLTFYNWNRWYLLVYSMVVFFIPLIDVFDLLQQHGLQHAAVISYIPALPVVNQVMATPETDINWWVICAGLIATGSVLMAGRLLIQFLSLRRLKSSAVLLSDGEVKLFHIDKKIIPFSTRSAIYVNRHLHAEHELKEIIRHEFIHVKQRHSMDLWWGELLCILNWYNPFAWLIRKAMRQNLEFIADHQVLQSGLDRKQYQYLLLKVTGIAPFSIATNFNFSSLKKRIVMMNKNKSANVHLMRFLFILPLLVVVLLAFRKVAISNSPSYVDKKITDTVPVKEINVEEDFKQKGIKRIMIKEKTLKAEVIFKNGTVKTFDLTKADEKEAFDSEYGDLVPPPPPTAPRPAKAPRHAAPAAPAAAPNDAPAPPSPAALPGEPAAPAAVPAPAAPKWAAGFRAAGTTSFVESATSTPVEVAVAPVAVTASGNVSITEGPVSGPVEVTVRATKAEIRNVTARGTATGTINKRTLVTADMIEVRPVTAVHVTGTGTIDDAAEVLAEIKNTTTRQELEQLAAALKEKGYSLSFNNVGFDNGELVSLEGSISNGSEKGNFSGDHFKTLTVSVHKNNGKRYFLVGIRGGSVSFQQ
ncbi:hypothetical protein D3H65_20140 [Paraflavitalea soli]|uniref:Peptidase M56 domain-containing protein n=1 Tax=Paraflavitalea soli TaxID=2315862 RepID=A0A3B7MQT6_9BACT|nr:M56 family metallopeptidase [Paraflavitalea soli]AXY76157.1 hypothetical protein D3H65_20140 [Paraflavitalea soli]